MLKKGTDIIFSDKDQDHYGILPQGVVQRVDANGSYLVYHCTAYDKWKHHPLDITVTGDSLTRNHHVQPVLDPPKPQIFRVGGDNIDEVLEERGQRYGSFEGHAGITQDIKRVMVASPKWGSLSAPQKESLEMVAHKIGRILNGDPNYKDSWTDIVGYARLVEETL